MAKPPVIDLDRDHQVKTLNDYVKAVIAATTKAEATFVRFGGQVVAVIMPAVDYHDPKECCCKNCPWEGNHA